jgi:hypothetical protein
MQIINSVCKHLQDNEIDSRKEVNENHEEE